MKTFASALALLLAVACASVPPNLSSEAGDSGRAAGFTNDLKNAPSFVLLSSPNQLRTWDFTALEPRGFHVRGVLTNRGFQPAGEIQGSGKLCTEGKDWLSLSELKVHTVAEGKAPVAPYILGCATSRGFEPASRSIVTQ